MHESTKTTSADAAIPDLASGSGHQAPAKAGPKFAVDWNPSSREASESSAIALGSISLSGGAVKSLVISALPAGAVLSDGQGHSFTATAGQTSVVITAWNLGTLSIVPPNDSNFVLTVTATHASGATATASEAVVVDPFAPTVSTGPISGVEGSAIALNLAATANGLPGDSNNLSSLVISSIPVGAVLSDGNGHSFTAAAGNTQVDVHAWNTATLTITTSNDQNFTLGIAATAADSEGNTSTTTHATQAVTVNPVAPAVGWSPSAETGAEGSPFALGTISATANGLAGDSNSLASLVVSAIPAGATLSDGSGHSFTASAGHTATDVLGWSLSSLAVTPATAANFTLMVTATGQDAEGNLGASASATEAVTVNPMAPTVSWSPSAEIGVENSPIALGTITAVANGLAGDSNSLASLVVSDIPMGATLSDGNGHSFTASAGQTSAGVLGWSLASLAITPTTAGNFTLTVTASEQDAEGNPGASTSATEAVTAHAPQNPYTSFDLPNEWSSYAQSINDSGQVAGWYQDNSGVHGFVYTGGIYTILDDPLTTNGTAAQAINGAGEVAGYFFDNSGQQHGFVDNAGIYTTLDAPAAVNGTVALAINGSGAVAGYDYDSSFQSHGFLYSSGTYTALDDPLATNGTTPQAINDSKEVAGYYQDNSATHGFIYNGGAYTTLDDPLATGGTVALAINQNGEVAGYYYDNAGQHGFIYNSGTYTSLDDPLATAGGTFAAAINNIGQVAGNYTDNTGQHGFVYSNGTYTTVDEPAATSGTTITAINGSGQVAGAYFTPQVDSFIYDAGSFTNLQDPLAATQTYANAINDSGQVAGFEIDSTGFQHGFLYSSGTYTALDDPLATKGTNALAINGSGEVAGEYNDNSGQHGFIYDAGTYTTLDDPLSTNGTGALGINAAGEVVGNYNDNTTQHGFIYSAGTYTTLDDPFALFGTTAQAINAAGEVAGSYNDNTGQHGFIYNAGSYTTLDDPMATGGTAALSVNLSGEVVGYYNDNTGQHGFIYNAGTYTTLDDPLATDGTYALGINDSGQATGYYTDNAGQHGFLYSNGTYTTIDNPLTTQNVTGVAAINNLGEVVGYYDPPSLHGFATV